uniref:Uncharacterized protein n=1 Tax=Hucho hucho TaxID=62062 RepID=A0A4W5M2P6_9TELE
MTSPTILTNRRSLSSPQVHTHTVAPCSKHFPSTFTLLQVRVRRCPLTYGVGVLNRFVEGRHPRDKLLVKEGRDWCTDILDRFVSVDQSVALGEVVRRSYTPARSGQRKIIINIYCSISDDVVYISDPGVRKCGAITLDLPEALPGTVAGAERREIRATMQFGDTEIKVMAVDMATNQTVRAVIDFLSN